MYSKNIEDRIVNLKQECKLLMQGIVLELYVKNVIRLFYKNDNINEEGKIDDGFWDMVRNDFRVQTEEMRSIFTGRIKKFKFDVQQLAQELGENEETFFEQQIKYIPKVDFDIRNFN
jgi:hypothetical protein